MKLMRMLSIANLNGTKTDELLILKPLAKKEKIFIVRSLAHLTIENSPHRTLDFLGRQL